MMRLGGEKKKKSLLLWWLLKIYDTHFVPAKQIQLPPACLQEKCPLLKKNKKQTQTTKQPQEILHCLNT